jgi:hypothetical protein
MHRTGRTGLAAILLAVGAVALSSPVAQATSVKRAALPNPCTTFTTAQAHALFGGHPKLSKTSINSSSYRTCVVAASTRSLHVTVTRTKGATPSHYTCYSHASLGSGGRVCLSTSRTAPGTTAYVARDGVLVIDDFSRTLGSHGKALFRLAVQQHKALK